MLILITVVINPTQEASLTISHMSDSSVTFTKVKLGTLLYKTVKNDTK